MKKRSLIHSLLILLYIVFAIYFLNYPFKFLTIPKNILEFEPWIIFIGGILLVIGGFSYTKVRKNR